MTNSAPSRASVLHPGRSLTDEQACILDRAVSGQSMKITALAGTGKTTTLQEIAAVTAHRRSLYLAFGRANAEEATRKFGHHVTVKTGHALAYAAIGNAYRARLERKTWAIREAIRARFGRQLNQLHYSQRIAVGAVLDTLNAFLCSADGSVNYQHISPDSRAECRVDALVTLTQTVFTTMANPHETLPVSDDVYLKVFQLQKPLLATRGQPFELIYFDEAQDANAVLLDIVRRQPCQLAFVGDSNQSIYGFRRAVNALESIDLPAYALTQSWRFGGAVANIANLILAAKDEPLRVRGRPDRVDKIAPVDVPDAVLARTNAGLFEEVLVVLPKLAPGDRVAFMGGFEAVKQSLLAAHDLWKHGRTTHVDFRAFSSWNDFCEAAESGQGGAFATLVKLVERHKDDLRERCSDIDEVAIEDHTKARAVFSTSHKFKGFEAPAVRIAGDFPAFCDFNFKTRRWEFDVEEANLAYVAVTRAEHILDLSQYALTLKRSLENCKRLAGNT